MREIQNPTLAEQLQALALQVEEVEAHKDYAFAEIHKLRGEVSILWDVAYEGLERGAAYYALVQRRTGQPREQAERHFLPDNAICPAKPAN